MANYILIGGQKGRSDKQYYDDLISSFEGRIPYSDKIYEETAFQWLGPIIAMFRKTINLETRFVRAYWIGVDGKFETTSCKISDSWGYHPGTMWHRVKPNTAEISSYGEFVANPENKEIVDKYFMNHDWAVTDRKEYMKLTRKVWHERAMNNLKNFVSAEEMWLKEKLEKLLEGINA